MFESPLPKVLVVDDEAPVCEFEGRDRTQGVERGSCRKRRDGFGSYRTEGISTSFSVTSICRDAPAWNCSRWRGSRNGTLHLS